MTALRDRIVAITGAASGIGAALARRMAAEGARVALLDRDAPGAERLAAELASDGAGALAIACDVVSPEACTRAVDAIVAAWGGIDVLVNNAGITHVGLFRDTEVDVIRRVMEVNVFGALHGTKAALPSLLERRGHVVVLSSVAGLAPLATRCGYAASKHALHGFFGSLRAEHRAEGLRVTLVCPSFVRTAIGDAALGPDGRAAPGTRTGVRGAIDPAEAADAIVRGIVADRRVVYVPGRARWIVGLSRILPGFYDRLMTRRTLGR